jgi:hypothetical protein
MIGLGMFGLGIRKRRAGVWLAMALVFGVVATLVSTSFVRAQFGLREVPPKNEFFRFKAKYTVKATGEVIQFDLVRPCRAVYATDLTGDSIGLGPGKFDPASYFGNVGIFPKVTADHHLIIAHIPFKCEGGTTANGGWPPDMLPWTTWFDDADNLTFGWMYATEDAYKSSLATITFDGASIEAADKNDFIEWQKHAGDHFRPSKMVVHPFGFTFNDRVHKDIPSLCFGVRRITLPEEIRALARAAWPSSHPRYWTLDAAIADGKAKEAADLKYEVMGMGSRKHLFDGHPKDAYIWGTDVADFPQTIPTRAGKSGGWPPVFYPIVAYPYGKPFLTPERLASNELYFDVDPSPDRYGFLGCYMHGSYGDPIVRDVTDMDSRTIVWRIGGERVFGQPHENPRAPGGPHVFFERDEFWFTGAHDGL